MRCLSARGPAGVGDGRTVDDVRESYALARAAWAAWVSRAVWATPAVHLLWRELPLVDDGRCGERVDVKVFVGGIEEDSPGGELVQPPQLTVEVGLLETRLWRYEQHLRVWLTLERCRAEFRVVDWKGAPADQAKSLRGHLGLDCSLACLDCALVLREEHDPRSVAACGWQRSTQLGLGSLAQEAVWHASEDASAVARGGVAATATAVGHAHKHHVRIADDLVTRRAFEARRHADATGIDLARRIIQALPPRKARQRGRVGWTGGHR